MIQEASTKIYGSKKEYKERFSTSQISHMMSTWRSSLKSKLKANLLAIIEHQPGSDANEICANLVATQQHLHVVSNDPVCNRQVGDHFCQEVALSLGRLSPAGDTVHQSY
jgi:hypothetical protein